MVLFREMYNLYGVQPRKPRYLVIFYLPLYIYLIGVSKAFFTKSDVNHKFAPPNLEPAPWVSLLFLEVSWAAQELLDIPELSTLPDLLAVFLRLFGM